MTIHSPCARGGLLAVLSLTLAGASLGQTAEPARIHHGPSPAGPLELLREQYAQVWSVHLRATAEVTICGEPVDGVYPVLRVGAGSYDYWAEGDKFRLRSQVDPTARPFALDTEEAFDGEFFQLLLISMDTLSLRREHLPITTASLPNPFFEPLAFLNAPSDECPGCTLRLPDLRDQERWQRALAAFEQPRLGRHRIAARIEGRPLRGTTAPTVYIPSLRTGQPPRVERLVIEREGIMRCVSEFEYSDDRSLEAQIVPRVIDVFCEVDTKNEIAAEAMGVAAVRRVVEVHALTLNQAWPPETFRIRREGRKAIIDEDEADRLGPPFLPVYMPVPSAPSKVPED